MFTTLDGLRFGVADVGWDHHTVVIVLNIGSRVIGMVVDGVSDVMKLGAEQLRPVPEFNARVATEHLMAFASIDRRMLILIDIDKLMASPDMGLITDTVH